jgi:hypothetical protein
MQCGFTSSILTKIVLTVTDERIARKLLWSFAFLFYALTLTLLWRFLHCHSNFTVNCKNLGGVLTVTVMIFLRYSFLIVFVRSWL